MAPPLTGETGMRRIAFLLVTVATAAGVDVCMALASDEAEKEAAPIFLTEIPQGHRDLRLISVSRLTAGNGSSQSRAGLGNDIALKAYREGKLPFPEGAIVGALHWKEVSSEENNKVLAKAFLAPASNLSHRPGREPHIL